MSNERMTDMEGWMRDVADAAASLDKRGDRQMSARLMRLHRDMDIARLRGEAAQGEQAVARSLYDFKDDPQPVAVAGDARDRVMGELEQWFDTQGVDVGSAAESVIAALSAAPAAPAPVAGDFVAMQPVAEVAMSDDGYKIGLLGPLRAHRLPLGTKLYASPEAALAQDRASQAGAAGVPALRSALIRNACYAGEQVGDERVVLLAVALAKVDEFAAPTPAAEGDVRRD